MISFFWGIKRGFRLYGDLVSFFISTVVLSFAYFFVLGPTAIIQKLFKKRLLEPQSEWKVIKKREKNSFFRQF